jgi:hypothetical protein
VAHNAGPAGETGLPDGFPDALVLAVAALLPDLHREDAILPTPRALDASAAVHLDEAADAAIPALAAVMYAEKLAAPARVVQAPAAKLHLARMLPAAAEAPCTPVAGRSAA